MPELPEVEAVARGLRKTIIGLTVSDIHLRSKASVHPGSRKFRAALIGAIAERIDRRGKNILIHFSNAQTLWVHLKMTGHFDFVPSDSALEKHDHVVFHFTKNNHTLRFNDYRRFGRMRLYATAEIMKQKGLAELGPEPLEISADDFVDRCRSSRRMIKPALLDQSFLAGLGNIYADETLFFANIHPRKLTDHVQPKRLKELHSHIQAVLKRAIRMMGTSVDTFSGLNGRPGGFQKYLMVYGREGEPCFACGTRIRREQIGSRSAHFCPSCQRLK
jgi:formamidopyrimidine-DNA glycosylase